MEKLNQTCGIIDEGYELECEIVREHLIPQWDKKDYNSFKSYVDDALKSYKMSDDIDTPEIERIIFKPPNNPIKDIDNPVNKILVTEKERDDNFDVVKIVQDYVIEIGSEFYCSEKKANCLVEGFEPYD